MLDGIRQQMAAETMAKPDSIPPPSPSTSGTSGFDCVMQPPPEPEGAEAIRPQHQEDRGDLGEGWDTVDSMDADRYEDSTLAAAAGSVESEQTPVASAEGGEASPVTDEDPAPAAGQATESITLLADRLAAAPALASADAAAGQVAMDIDSVAEPAAGLAELLPSTPDAEGMQAGAGASQARVQPNVEMGQQVIEELAQDGESRREAGSALTDEVQIRQIGDSTRGTEIVEPAEQVEATADTRGEPTGESRGNQTVEGPPDVMSAPGSTVPAADLGGMNSAGGEASGQELVAGEASSNRLSTDAPGSNAPEA